MIERRIAGTNNQPSRCASWRMALSAALACAALAVLSGCPDPSKDIDLKKLIEDDVHAANADIVTVRVEPENDSEGSTTPFPTYDAKVGIPFSIYTTVNADYAFIRWEQTGGNGEVVFEDATKTETKATVKKKADNIVITATFDARPYVAGMLPTGNGVMRNQPIRIEFSELIDSTTLSLDTTGTGSGTISVKARSRDVLNPQSAVSIADIISFTITQEPAGSSPTFTAVNLDVKSGQQLPGQNFITVTVRKNVSDIAGNIMKQDVSWEFITGNSVDENPPVINSFWIMQGGATLAADGKTKSRMLTLNFEAADDGIMETIHVVETHVTDMDGTPISRQPVPTDLDYAKSTIYSLATTGDGRKNITVTILDTFRHVSASKSQDIILDTTGPVASAFSAECGAWTNLDSVLIHQTVSDGGTLGSAVSNISASFSINGGVSWQAWQPVVAVQSIAISGTGAVIVAKYRDELGNETASSAYPSVTVSRDVAAPTISSVRINAGALYATATAVSLSITAVDSGGSGLASYRLAETSDFSGSTALDWAAWTSTPSFTLTSGDGPKTVYVQVRDAAGNLAAGSGGITLDLTPPVISSFQIAGSASYTSSAAVSVSLSAADGTGSGISGYQLKQGTPPTDADGWTSWDGAAITPSFTLSGTDGAKTVYVRVKDAAGRVSSSSDDVILDTCGPAISAFSVASGAAFSAPATTVSITASDAGVGVSAYQLKQGSMPTDADGWTNWTGGTISPAFTLSGADGMKTVYVRVKDSLNNISTSSDGVTLDGTAPTITDFRILAGAAFAAASTTLNVAASDAGSGVSAYQVKQDTAPTDADGWTVWTGAAIIPAFSLTGADGSKTVYLRVKDGVGNIKTGQDDITLDATGPTISTFSVAGAASYCVTPTTLDIAASDGSGVGVSAYQVKQGSMPTDADGWTSWTGAAISPAFSLSGVDGLKTVYIRAKDSLNNVSTSSDDVTLDTTAPGITTFRVAGGAAWAPLSTTVDITASDAGVGVSAYQVKQGSMPTDADGWTNWTGGTISPAFTLSGADGGTTVYLRVKDSLGHIGTAQDDVTLDGTLPDITTFSIAGGANYCVADTTLDITASDAGSGVAAYQVKQGSMPTDADGWTNWTGGTISPAFTLSGADGNTTVYLRVKDTVGNIMTAQDSVYRDTTAPGITTFRVAGGANYCVADTTLDITASDAGVGVSAYQVKQGSMPTDADGWTNWTGGTISPAFTLSGADGGTTVYLRVKDSFDHIGTAQDNVTLDTTAPGITTFRVAGGAAWAPLSTTVDITASDAGVGVSAYQVKQGSMPTDADGWTNWTGGTISPAFTLSGADGGTTVYLRVKDSLGHIGTAQDDVTLDGTLPDITTFSIAGGAAWAPLSTTVDITASDAGVGVSAYQVKQGSMPTDADGWTNWTGGTISPAFTLTGADGNTTVYLRVKDTVGNIMTAQDSVYRDTTAPGITTFRVAGGANYCVADTTVDITASDAGVGVSAYQVKQGAWPTDADGWTNWTGGTISPAFTLSGADGGTTVYLRVKDSLDHVGTAQDDVTLDTAAPGITTFRVAGGAAWAPLSTTVDITASDAGVGVTAYQVKQGSMPTDADGWTNWTGGTISPAFTLSGADGGTTVYLRVKDSLDHIGTTQDDVTLDGTQPDITTFSIAGGANYCVADTTLDITASDAGVGVSAYQVKQGSMPTDADGWTNWTGGTISPAFTLSGTDGNTTVYLRVKDTVGNIRTAQDSVYRDTTAPGITTFRVAGGANYCVADTTLDITASDAGVGVTAYQVKQGSMPTDADGWTNWTGGTISPAFTLSGADGGTTVYLRVKDSLDHIGTAQDDVTLDTAAPGITTFRVAGGAAWAPLSTTVDITASDAGVGVSAYQVKQGSMPTDADGWTNWTGGSISPAFTLSGADGGTTVYLRVKDSLDHIGTAQDDVTLDSTAPEVVTATFNVSAALELNADFTEAGSGLDLGTDKVIYWRTSSPATKYYATAALADSDTFTATLSSVNWSFTFTIQDNVGNVGTQRSFTKSGSSTYTLDTLGGGSSPAGAVLGIISATVQPPAAARNQSTAPQERLAASRARPAAQPLTQAAPLSAQAAPILPMVTPAPIASPERNEAPVYQPTTASKREKSVVERNGTTAISPMVAESSPEPPQKTDIGTEPDRPGKEYVQRDKAAHPAAAPQASAPMTAQQASLPVTEPVREAAGQAARTVSVTQAPNNPLPSNNERDDGNSKPVPRQNLWIPQETPRRKRKMDDEEWSSPGSLT